MELVLPPSIIANQADWTLIDYSGIQQSPMSGAIRTISRGQRWQAHLAFHDLIGNDRASMASLIAAIRGKSNRVWFADPTYKQQGSFPAPELLANGSFQAGPANWSAGGSATLTGFNRTLFVQSTGVANPGAYQSIPLTVGVAYALRACIIDGPATAGLSLGVRMGDGTNLYGNVSTTARGLMTAAAVALASGTGQQTVALMTNPVAGAFAICTYASLRRCALVQNSGGLTFYTALTVDALPVSTLGLLRAGDCVEINGEFKRVTYDLNSDGAGIGQLMFEPALRKIVPDNAPVIIGEPMMRAVMSNDALQPSRPGGFSDFDFTFVEA